MAEEREVVGIVTSGVSRGDCRCIDRLVYREGGDGPVRDVRASQAYFDCRRGITYYLERDGQRHELEPATKFNVRYVRAASTDVPEDPLLELPEIEATEATEL